MKKLRPITTKLKELAEEFEKWRAKRVGAEPIPQELWEKAVEQVPSHTLQEVAHHLRINYMQLKGKYEASLAKATTSESSSLSRTGFLELNSLSFSALAANQPTLPQINNQNQNQNQTQNQNQSQSQSQSQSQHTDKNKEKSCQIVYEKKDGSKLSISMQVDVEIICQLSTTLLRA